MVCQDSKELKRDDCHCPFCNLHNSRRFSLVPSPFPAKCPFLRPCRSPKVRLPRHHHSLMANELRKYKILLFSQKHNREMFCYDLHPVILFVNSCLHTCVVIALIQRPGRICRKKSHYYRYRLLLKILRET